MICPSCSRQVELTTGDEVYPHRPDLHNKWFYVCRPCWAYVGCHPGTKDALGTVANAALRTARHEAHVEFDRLWKSGKMSRKAAYRKLSRHMGLSKDETHIGMFDLAQCRSVVDFARGCA